MTPDRRTLLALFSFAFGLRVLYAVLAGSFPALAMVKETYDFRIAARMATDLNWITSPFSPNAPGYLWLLAAAFKVAGASWWTAVLVNAVLGAGTTLFLFRIGEKRLGRGVGLASALWLGAFPHQIVFASLALRDVLATFLFVWFVYSLVKPFHRMRNALWSAFLYTALTYTEPRFLVLLPLILVYLVIWATHHRTLSVQYTFLFLTCLLVLNVPWTVRNYAVRRDLIPISLEATRYAAPIAHLLRESPPAPPPEPQATVVHPPGFLHKSLEFWRIGRLAPAPADPAHGLAPEPAWSLRHNAISIASYGFLLPLFAVGMIFAFRRRQRSALILAGVTLSYALACGFLEGNDRARLPVEPLIILLGFYGVRVLLDLRRSAGAPAS